MASEPMAVGCVQVMGSPAPAAWEMLLPRSLLSGARMQTVHEARRDGKKIVEGPLRSRETGEDSME